MFVRPFRGRSLCDIILATLISAVSSTTLADDVSFSRDVMPILSDRCFRCHGPDDSHREADLRLDQEASAKAQRDGGAAIVANDPKSSTLLHRVRSSDPDTVMPPPDSGREPLTPDEAAVLERWIAGGAVWGKHWAFEKPLRPEVPGDDPHPVDAFIVQRLKQNGLAPAEPAPRHTQLRRLSFDLTGLPPTAAELSRFIADDSEKAWQHQVDRLLQSPHYGERMAMWWLDAARYSDTDGYQGDATRNNWAWRDWVVDAFNRNMRFDQFTREQFAGDLLPDATNEQKLATCFHRNHMTNGEGGRLPEESRIDYVIDRVNTTGTVWLGLTLGCAQCHSHKFDPISHRDYYSVFAFFDSIDEDGKAGGGAKPFLKYKSSKAAPFVAAAEQLVATRAAVESDVRKDAEAKFEKWLQTQVSAVKAGFDPWAPLHPRIVESVEGTRFRLENNSVIQSVGPDLFQDDYRVIAGTNLKRVTGIRLEVFPHNSHTQGRLSRGASGLFILTDVKLQVRRRGRSQVRDIELASAVADAELNVGGRAYGRVGGTLDDDPRNGWLLEEKDAAKPHRAVFALQRPLELEPDEELIFVLLHRSTNGDANVGRFRVSVTDQPGDAVRSLGPMPLEELAQARPDSVRSVDRKLRGRLLKQFLTDHASYQTAKGQLDAAKRQLSSVRKSTGALNVMVLAERSKPRTSHILERGVWDKKGAQVERDVPDAILPWPAESKTRSRLAFAEWLTSKVNPLTARVVVNHLWQMLFGAGLVRTPEDFGLQGERPTHPDLLDWLAVELVESGWDLKHIQRLMVTSRAYRQSSRLTPGLRERDPDNRLLARAPRYRLPAWMIRDAALHASGLLNPALGGPPVRPYQPPGVWAEMFMGRFRYEPSQGDAQFRRTLYAFWRRSAAPTFLFDSAQRRVCEVRPRLTNTPLHALTLMNDLSIREAARGLAQWSVTRQQSTEARVSAMFQRVCSREPTPREHAVLVREARQALRQYAQSPEDARAWLEFGQPEHRPDSNHTELAAYTLVACMILNLDEAITHE